MASFVFEVNLRKRLMSIRTAYQESILNPSWISKSHEIKQRDSNSCQKCGEKTNLYAHHRYYVNGRLPWEYPNSAIVTLCNKCHAKVHLEEIPIYEEYDLPLLIEENDKLEFPCADGRIETFILEKYRTRYHEYLKMKSTGVQITKEKHGLLFFLLDISYSTKQMLPLRNETIEVVCKSVVPCIMKHHDINKFILYVDEALLIAELDKGVSVNKSSYDLVIQQTKKEISYNGKIYPAGLKRLALVTLQ